MSRKFYLVTGGSGFLGFALVKRLLKQGHKVRVLDNNWRGKSERLEGLAKDLEFIEADIRDSDKVSKASKGVDGVFHLAFINGTRYFYEEPELVLDVGVTGMLNVLKACRAHEVAELFLASSSEVYQLPKEIPTSEDVALTIPDPLNPRYSYAGGKLISELLALNFGKKDFERVVIFRPHNVYGPDMGMEHVIPQFILRMLELVAKKAPEPLQFDIQGDGSETRAFIYVEDFIDGIMLLLDKGKHLNIYHVGTEEEVAIGAVAQKVAQYFKRRITLKPGKITPGSTPRRCPDTKKMRALGFKPETTLEEGIALTASWYEKMPKSKEKKKSK